MARAIVFVVITTALFHCIEAPPPLNERESGPCVGMDCLHGVLMHGDAEQGDNHKAEDMYDNLQAQDVLKAASDNIGPCQGKDCMEAINHPGQDPDEVHKMNQKAPGPEKVEEQGPCQGMDCMHGVLMHGDAQQGIDHAKEDAKVMNKDTDKFEGQIPKVDPDTALHGANIDHNKAPEKKTRETRGRQAPKMDPESALHGGDIDHSHDPKDQEKDTKPVAHLKREPDIAHLDALLHGGEYIDHNKERERQKNDYAKDTVGDLESLLHGSDDAHDIHNRDPDERPSKYPSDVEVGVLDPHAMFHGEQKIGFGKVSKDELADFKAWEQEKKPKVAKEGFTLAYITDTIMSELDIFRQRYIPKFWGEHHEDDADVRLEPLDESVFDLGDEDSEEAFEDGDMRHELEDIGNSRTKTQTNLRKLQEVDRQQRFREKRRRRTEI